MDKRDFLRATGAMALGLTLRDAYAQAQKPPYKGPYNFLFILTDQERFFRPGELPDAPRRHRRRLGSEWRDHGALKRAGCWPRLRKCPFLR